MGIAKARTVSAMRIFESSINSETTKKQYLRSLNNFFDLFKITDPDSYVLEDPDTIHDNLVTYVHHEKSKRIKNHSIKNKLNAIFLFLEMNKVAIHKRIFRKMLPEDDQRPGGDTPFTTDEVSRMLEVTDKLRSKAVIHFLASTGCRPGAIVDPVLRMKHLYDMPDGCKAIKIYDNSKEGYWAFLTPEASRALRKYHQSRKVNGETLTDESPVFSNSSDVHKSKGEPISIRSVRELMYRILNNAGIERERVGRRYDKAAIYGFRKRLNGILKINNDVNSNIAEKLMAHKRGLDGTYLRPTREQCFEEFRKAVFELTIDSSERDRLEIKRLESEKTELQQKTERIEELEKKYVQPEMIKEEALKKLKQEILAELNDPKLLMKSIEKMFAETRDNKKSVEEIIKETKPKSIKDLFTKND